jgi:hypothetical protein
MTKYSNSTYCQQITGTASVVHHLIQHESAECNVVRAPTYNVTKKCKNIRALTVDGKEVDASH